MKSIYCYIILFTFGLSIVASAQVPFTGRVLEVNSGNKGLSGVKVFSKYAIDTVLTDAEGYFSINLSENSYLAIAGLGFLKRGFLVNNPAVLFDYKVGDELSIYMVDFIKREKQKNQLREDLWFLTRERLIGRIGKLDSSKKSFKPKVNELYDRAWFSDSYFARACWLISFVNLDQKDSVFKNFIQCIRKGNVPSVTDLESYKPLLKSNKELKELFLGIHEGLQLSLEYNKNGLISKVDEGYYNTRMPFETAYSPFSEKETEGKEPSLYDSFKQTLYDQNKKRIRSSGLIDISKPRYPKEKIYVLFDFLYKINPHLLLNEEVNLRNANQNFLKSKSSFIKHGLNTKSNAAFLTDLEKNHPEYLKYIQLHTFPKSSSRDKSNKLLLRNIAIKNELRQSISFFELPAKVRLKSTLLYTAKSYGEKVQAAIEYNSLYPHRIDFNVELSNLSLIHNSHDPYELEKVIKVLRNRQERFKRNDRKDKYFKNLENLHARTLLKAGKIAEGKDLFDEICNGILSYRKKYNNDIRLLNSYFEYLDEYVDVLLLDANSEGQLSKINRVLEVAEENGLKTPRLAYVKELKRSFSMLHKSKKNLQRATSSSWKIENRKAADGLWEAIYEVRKSKRFYLASFENRYQLARLYLEQEPLKTFAIANLQLQELQNLKFKKESAMVQNVSLLRAFSMALSDNWEGAEPKFLEFKELAHQYPNYRERVLLEAQILFSKGVKHENLYKILEMFQ